MGKMVPLPKDMENVYAKPARCPHCGYVPGAIRSDFVAPALPGEVETWDAELEWEEQGGHVCPVVYMRRVHVGQVAEPYVKHSDYADLTRRLAEAEQIRSEWDALRERCEKLKAALVEIKESEDRICSYCEGEGNRYADGKAHYYSEHAPTILCPECGGRGRIRDMDSEDMAAVALAALAAMEVKP